MNGWKEHVNGLWYDYQIDGFIFATYFPEKKTAYLSPSMWQDFDSLGQVKITGYKNTDDALADIRKLIKELEA